MPPAGRWPAPSGCRSDGLLGGCGGRRALRRGVGRPEISSSGFELEAGGSEGVRQAPPLVT
jgi:hypothetical protein